MTYQYPLNWIYNGCSPISYYGPGYNFSIYSTLEVLRPFFPTQFPNKIEINEGQPQVRIEIKATDTRDSPNHGSDESKHYEIKKSRDLKIKKKSRNIQKELESAKKNCESNLVNQFLSYFSSYNNSYPLIVRALKKMNLQIPLIENKQLEQSVVFFCKQISIVNSRKERKYVNKAFLQNYFFEFKLQKYMPDILQNVEKSEFMTKNQFCELFRRCCFHFFRTVSVSSVTSSAKLNPISRPEHIKRRRLIVESLGKK